jgi:hypothetical protein
MKLRGELFSFLVSLLVLVVASQLARDLTIRPHDLFVIPMENRR